MYPGIFGVQNPADNKVDCVLCRKQEPHYSKISDNGISESLGTSICLAYGIRVNPEIVDLLHLSYYCPECTDIILDAHKIILTIRELELQLGQITTVCGKFLKESIEKDLTLGAGVGYELHSSVRKKIEWIHCDVSPPPPPEANASFEEGAEDTDPSFERTIISTNAGECTESEPETENINLNDAPVIEIVLPYELHYETEPSPVGDDSHYEEFHFEHLNPEPEAAPVSAAVDDASINEENDLKPVSPELEEYSRLKLRYNLKECFVKLERLPSKLRRFECSACGKAYARRQNLRTHACPKSEQENDQKDGALIPRPNEDGSFTCTYPVCLRTFAKKSSVVSHMYLGHPGYLEEMEARPRKYQCEQCGRGFRYSAPLKAHIQTVHEKLRPYECSVCGKTFTARKYLKAHACPNSKQPNKNRNDTISQPNPSRYLPHQCERCGKFFERSHVLRKHISSVHEKLRPFKCHLCDKTFIYKKYLNYHLQYHTEDGLKRPTCTICSRDFISDQVLNVHMLQHTREFKFKCNLCEFGCGNQKALDRHMFKHAPEKMFECSECGAKFKFELSLKSHLKVRHGSEEERLRCRTCGKEYSGRFALKKHEEIHAGEDRPYLCNICGKTFTTQFYLKGHIKTCHSGRNSKPKGSKPRKRTNKAVIAAAEVSDT